VNCAYISNVLGSPSINANDFSPWIFINLHPLSQFIASTIILSPIVFLGLWFLLVPVDVDVNTADSSIAVIRWRSLMRVPFTDIDRVKVGISVFDTLWLKSGKKIIYVAHKGNKSLRGQFSPAGNI
jgi:hypothetical protein